MANENFIKILSIFFLQLVNCILYIDKHYLLILYLHTMDNLQVT